VGWGENNLKFQKDITTSSCSMSERLDIGLSSPFIMGTGLLPSPPLSDTQKPATKKKKLIQIVGSDSEDDEPPPIEDNVDDFLLNIAQPPEPPPVVKPVVPEGPSLADLMFEEAAKAKKVKDFEDAKVAAKQAKKSMGGLKGGFFNKSNKGSKKKKTKPMLPKPKEEPIFELDASGEMVETIPTIRKNNESSNKDSKIFAEVQEAMKKNPMEGLDKTQWANDNLMQTIAKNPRLAMGLQNPRFAAAIQELQKNPKEAMEKYKSDKAIFDFLNEFCGVMGDHFAKLGEDQARAEEAKKAAEAAEAGEELDDLIGPLAKAALDKDEEKRKGGGGGGIGWDDSMSKKEKERVDSIVSNQHLSSILMDPKMQRIIQECNHPGRMQMYMKDDEWGPKLRLLIDNGLLKVER